jgi:exodeoxyribonuclease-1
MLNLYKPEVILHTSGMYPSTICNTTAVYPLMQHPGNKNGVIVFDLRFSPQSLETLSAEQIIERLYTPRDQLPEGVERIPIKTIHINKCPVVAPMNTLDEASAERTEIDQQQISAHLQMLQAIPGLNKKLQQVFSHNPFEPETDPDKNLYSGGFFSSDDKSRMQKLRSLSAEELAVVDLNFEDERIPEMLFRYRARNYPDSLTTQEQEKWNAYRTEKFTGDDNKVINFKTFKQMLNDELENPDLNDDKKQVLRDLQQWGEMISVGLDI